MGGFASAQAPDDPDRSVLPVARPKREPITEVDARKAKAPPRFEVKAPKGAPNVVFVLIDNMGFADPASFGGPVNMPAFDRLAQGGLRYNNLHTARVCSPTRVALLTGRNSHSANMGGVAEMATAFPGMTGVRPNSIAPLAEMGLTPTAVFGKSAAVGIARLRAARPLAGALGLRQVLRVSSGRVRRKKSTRKPKAQWKRRSTKWSSPPR